VNAFSSVRARAGLTEEQYWLAAEQLLLPALQLARSPLDQAIAGVISAAAAAAAAAGQGGVASSGKQQGRLRLTSFTSNLRAAGMLAALPADSLTALDLSPMGSIGADGRQLSALVARLSSLKQLKLDGPGTPSVPGSCFEGIAQLTGLTALELGQGWWDVDKQLQQLLLQNLPLRRLCLRMVPPVLDMTALARLTDLTLDNDVFGVAPGSKLPAQVQRVRLSYCEDTSALLGLQQLQHVSLGVGFEDPEQLRCLAQLPALQHLSLEYWDVTHAAPTAPAWQHLSQLSELSVEQERDDPSPQEFAAILAGVAAATSLTKLSLDARADDRDVVEELIEVAACASLAGLTRLRDLTISSHSCLVPGDALALTALTSLTRLQLASTGSAVDDVVASALACSLTQLRSLDLRGCALGGLACLAPIAHLSQLTELLLDRVDGINRRGLLLLTKLTRLQQLSVKLHREVNQEWMDQVFWPALRQRQ
jgi:hypothetical protein